jgi:hypothetical protein
MKIIYLIIGTLLLITLVAYLAGCRNKSLRKPGETAVSQDSARTKAHNLQENPYEGLRNMALNVKPGDLQLLPPAENTIVYGVVMDWGIDDATATVVAYQTGDASMYVSSGGGVIGGGKHQNVNDAAKSFVTLSQTFLDKASKTDITTLPLTDEVKFYLLTNKGHFVIEEQMTKFENSTSPWLPLFEEGNKLITELRITSEK